MKRKRGKPKTHVDKILSFHCACVPMMIFIENKVVERFKTINCEG